VFEIVLPTLRERIYDLELLIANIIQRLGTPDLIFTEDTLAALRNFRFPGNARESRNIVERSVLLADDGVVYLNHLPKQIQNHTNGQVSHGSEVVTLEEAEHRYPQQVLGHHKGDRKELAEKLGISSRVLYRKLAEMRAEP
jgi:two-component system NtrC family response regulator